MVKATHLALGAIPAALAAVIAVLLLTQTGTVHTAVNPGDEIDIEYTRHHIMAPQGGGAPGVQKTEILLIRNDGTLTYRVAGGETIHPDVHGSINASAIKKLTALIKETGFITIPPESFPVLDIDEYQKSTITVTLNGERNQIHWPEQNATEKFVAPIVTMVQDELDMIILELGE